MEKKTRYIVLMLLIVVLAQANVLAETLEVEKELHFSAWLETAEKAASIPQYKYALYASRSLAVKHPELYLQGDAIFDELLTSLPNMALFYTTRDKDVYELEEFLVKGFYDLPDLEGNRFKWETFELGRHAEISYQSLYKSAFQFPYLDLRLPPLGVSLLGWDYKATPLALAQMLYFQLKLKMDVRSAYLLVSETGDAYVAAFDRSGNDKLFDHRGLEKKPRQNENIVLIFNDKRVWYPLMERDDTRRDKNLRSLVAAYAMDNPLPTLTQEEEQLVELLRKATGKGNSKDRRWMSILASRLHTRAWGILNELQKLYPRWSNVYSSHGPDGFGTELAYIHRLGNQLSPAASYLAVYARTTYAGYEAPYYKNRLNHTIEMLSRRYNGYMGANMVLYPWWYHPELHFLSLDDSVFSKRANCIMISTNLASILDLAQIPDVTTYQVYIPGHVILLMTAAEGYYSILDNNRFFSTGYVPSAVRSLGFSHGWLRLQDQAVPHGLKDVYTSGEVDAAEEFMRVTLKDLTELYPYSTMTIAKPTSGYQLATQSYQEFLEQIDTGKIKIKKWK